MNKPVHWLLGITLCIYVQVFSFDFVNLDDPSHLDNNPYFSPLTVSNYLHFWKAPHFLYMPVTYTVWSLGILASPPRENLPRTATRTPREFRFSPLIFHFFTLFFHLLSTLFVFYCLTLFSPNVWVSFCGALLFALHPLQAEPVAWISALKDTLSGTFLFASLYFYFQEKRLLLSLALYLIALASKPSAVILPPALFLLSIRSFGHEWKTVLRRLAVFALPTLPILWMTARVQATESLHFQAPTLIQKCLVALDTLGFYVWKLFWPFNMTVDYGRTPKYVLTESPIITTAISVLIILSLLYYLLRRNQRKEEITGLLFSLLCLLPVLGFKPFSFQTTSTVSDRFMYFAMFGIALALLPTFDWILQRQRWLPYLGLLFVLLSLRTLDQVSYWRNTVTMFSRAIEVNPRSWLSYNNLGAFYERLDLPQKALENYREAAKHDRQGIFYNNIGSVCLSVRDFTCAKDAYLEAIEINSLSILDLNGLGFSYLGLGEKKKAREVFERAIFLNPDFTQSKMGLKIAEGP